jgi:hypothetical protein
VKDFAMPHDPDTPQTVREWLAEEPDPQKRIVAFADQLSEDFEHLAASMVAGCASTSAEFALMTVLLDQLCKRTNWGRISRRLLADFGPAARRCCCCEHCSAALTPSPN